MISKGNAMIKIFYCLVCDYIVSKTKFIFVENYKVQI